MNFNTIYILDANVFIEAYQRYYAFDLVPSFWDALIKLAKADRIRSIDRVKQEINKGDDQLKRWVNNHFSEWFMSTDDSEVFNSYQQIINWAFNHNQFKDYAKKEFASIADSWLVAYAKTYNCVVVTHEQFNGDIKKKIPIPNVCEEFDIPYIDTFGMLRRLNVKLS